MSHEGLSEFERRRARAIADDVWTFVRKHEQEAHDGEPCASNRVSVVAFVAHVVGLRAEAAGSIAEAMLLYQHDHENGSDQPPQ